MIALTFAACGGDDSLDAEDAVQQGIADIQAGDPDAAVEVLEKAIDEDSSSALGYYNLGVAESMRGNEAK